MPDPFINAVVTDPAEPVTGHVDSIASLRFGDHLTVQTSRSQLSPEQVAAYWRRVADAAARIAIELAGESADASAYCRCPDPVNCSDAAHRTAEVGA